MPFKIEQGIVGVHKKIQGNKSMNQHTSLILLYQNQNKTQNHWRDGLESKWD